MREGYPVCGIANTPFTARYLRYLESLLRDAEQFLTSNKRVKTTRLYVTLRFSCEAQHARAHSKEIDDGDEERKRAS